MSYPKSSAVYALVVGIMMVAMWTFFIAAAQVPELDSRPVEILFHLVVEFTTAAVLIAAGVATLRQRRWGVALQLFAFGMLVYTLMLSPGYYAQLGQMGFVVMFAALFVLTLLFLCLSVRSLVVGFVPASGQTTRGDREGSV